MTPRSILLLALCALLSGPLVVAQTTLGLQNETAAGSGIFGPQTEFSAFDGSTLTPAQYYNYSDSQYQGPAGTFAPPAVRKADLVSGAINVFYVNTARGLTLFWVAKGGGTGIDRVVAEGLHTVGDAAFRTPLSVRDDISRADTYVFSNGNATLTTSNQYGRERGDGFAARFTSADFTLDTELTSAVSINAASSWAIHRPDAAPIVISTEVGRALRFGPIRRTTSVTDVADSPGWRLLSTPVRGVTADDLAAQNLVQGVPGADGVPAQYPDVDANLYTGYAGGGRYDYLPAASTAAEIAPGRGFWWYWYDLDLDPDDAAGGGGTSESVDLDGFELTATGTELAGDTTLVYTDNTDSASDSGQPDANPDPAASGAPGGTVSPADDDFYLVGNPYPRPFAVSAMTVTGGTLADAAFIWNPANPNGTPPDDPDVGIDGPGSYEVVFQTPPDARPDSIAVWQGLLAEVTDPTPAGGQVSFFFDASGSPGPGAPPFYGRTAAERYVHLNLEGVTTDGAPVRDAAAYIRVRDDASAGWDRYDASKPLPPSDAFALIAPVGTRDGEPRRQAVLSLQSEASVARVPLAFTTSHAGEYTLTWEGTLVDATLTDRVTGDRVELATAGAYTFAAEAGGWAARFALVFSPSADGLASTADGGAPLASGAFVGPLTPNPAAGEVRLDLRLDQAADATVSVFDALGRQVLDVSSVALDAGQARTVTLPTERLAPGVYVVVVEAPGVRESRRLTVVR